MCWTYFHRDWLALLLLLGRIRLAYTVGDSSQQRRKGWRFIQKENPPEISRLSNAGGGVESFSLFLYSRGTEMTAAGRSGSTKVQWRRRTGVHIKDSRLECVHTFLFSLSLIYSHADVHTPLTDLLSARQTAVFNLCDNTCGWPLFARGSLELLPFE